MKINSRKLGLPIVIVMGLALIVLVLGLQLNVFELTKGLLFIVLSVFFAGFAISKLVYTENACENIAFSFGLGIGLNIIVYFLEMLLHTNFLILTIPVVLGLYGIFLFYKDITQHKAQPFKLAFSELIFLLTILIISVIGVSYSNLPVGLMGYTSNYKDVLWNISNTNSLILNFPPIDIRFDGLQFNYHYFASVFRAVMCMATGISADKVMVVYVQFATVPFLVFTLLSIGKLFFKSDNKALFFAFVFYFTNSASTEFIKRGSGYSNGLPGHVLYVPNGLDFAIPFMLLLIILYAKIINMKEKNLYASLLILTFLSGIVTGAKGPTGTMVFAMALGMLIISALKKEKFKRVFLSFICVTIGFSIVYLFILAAANDSYLVQFSPGVLYNISSIGWLTGWYVKTAISTVIGILPLPLMIEAGIINVLYFLATTLIHFWGFLFFVSVPFLLLLFKDVIHFKKASLENFILWGVAGSAILASYLFNTDGYGQVYYLYSAIAIIELLGLMWLSQNYKKLNIIFKCLIIFSFCVSLYTGVKANVANLSTFFPNVQALISDNKPLAEPFYNGLTKAEHEAMLWIKDNTPKNAVFATNRHFDVPTQDPWFEADTTNTARYFYYSAYCSRQMFLEGWAYLLRTQEMSKNIEERYYINKSFFDEKSKSRATLMRKNNVDYLIVSRFVNPQTQIDDPTLEKVFGNRDIAIYKAIQN